MNAKTNSSSNRDTDWLSDDIITYLETKQTLRQYHAGEDVPHHAFVDAFETLFPSLLRREDGYRWENQYQLEQAVIKVAG